MGIKPAEHLVAEADHIGPQGSRYRGSGSVFVSTRRRKEYEYAFLGISGQS